MSQEPQKELIRQCFGRFCLDVPATMARTLDEDELQEVSIAEALWKDPQDKARSLVWGTRLAGIEALASQREIPSDPQGLIREQRIFQPNRLQGVLFHHFENPAIATWGALLRTGPMDAWLQIDGDLSRHEEWAKRLVEVADAYQIPEPSARPVPRKDWFYLRYGAVALPMKVMEAAKVRFEGHPLGIKLEVSTTTVNEVKRQGLMDRLSNALSLSRELPGSLVTQKYQRRKVAGMDGEELILRYTEPGRSELKFLWRFEGEERSAKQPRIAMQMESSLEKDDDKVALWNHLLESLRLAVP